MLEYLSRSAPACSLIRFRLYYMISRFLQIVSLRPFYEGVEVLIKAIMRDEGWTRPSHDNLQMGRDECP
jgi:hypothetical protein